MARYELTWPPGKAPQRLDVAVHEQLPDLSRRKIRRIIDVGGVYLNGNRLRIATRQVNPGDKLVIEYNPAALAKATKPQKDLTPAALLELTERYIVLNKPAGLPSQPTRREAISDVGKALEKYLKKMGAKKSRTILVHRLDKETSGVMIVARDSGTATHLTDQFKAKTVAKEYWALVHGRPKRDRFVEQARLARIDRNGFVRVDREGRSAETAFEVLWGSDQWSLLKCVPTTGRSHQIRVHLAHNGLPIVGDKRYCQTSRDIPKPLTELAGSRHLLHAFSLSLIPSPGESLATFHAPLPAELQQWLTDQGFKAAKAQLQQK